MSRRGKGEGSISLRQDGRWQARLTYQDGGRTRRRSLYGKTRAEVGKKLRDALKHHDDGLPLASGRETVGNFLASWLRDSAAPALRPRTLDSYRQIVANHLAPELGRVALVKLTPAMIQAYMNSKRSAGLSARTVQYHHAILRRALGQAERWGKVSRNVARLVSPPKVERPEVLPLTPEQAQVFLKAVAESRDSALYACAVGLGLRQSELLGLGWADVNLDDGTLTVRRTLQRYAGAYHLDLPKTDRSRRTLGLPVSLVHALRAHRNLQLRERLKAGPAWRGDEWNLVFCTEAGAPMPGNYLTHRFQELLSSLHLPKQRFHDLRHASATYMLAQGVDLRVVMEVLGHSQIHVTANTYAHVKVDATRSAAENVDALLSR